MRRTPTWLFSAFLLLLGLCYIAWLEADNIGGMFGILWSDEGAYLTSAKEFALFGNPHPYAADAYFPEYCEPLLYHLAQLVLSKTNTVWGIRFSMAVLVLLGQWLVAKLAARYHGDRHAGRCCLLLVLLCPMLYFYARTGLTEGIQFFVMALALCAMWGLYHARSNRAALWWMGATAALVALLFLSKLSSAGACVGFVAGALACVCQHPFPRRARILLLLFGAAAGIFSLGLIFMLLFGDRPTLWIHVNFEGATFDENLPHTLGYAFFRLCHHFVGLQYFLSLMPIFAVGFWGLLIAANRKRGFLWVLWLITIVTLLVESSFGGELRRSFYGLSLLMILGGFTIGEWIEYGVSWARPWSISRWAALVMILLFVGGLLYFSSGAMQVHEPIYQITAPAFMAVLVGGALISGARRRRLRKLLLAILMLLALAPMVFQVLMAPHTIQKAIMAMEEKIPADQTVTGALLPWYFQGMRRDMLVTNCRPQKMFFANDPDKIDYRNIHYFLTFPSLADLAECNPPDFDKYHPVLEFSIFYPFNRGAGYGGSKHWIWYLPFVLFRKDD